MAKTLLSFVSPCYRSANTIGAVVKELTETVQKLAIALEKQGMALQSTEKKVDGVKNDVDEIKAKPAKRWDAIIAAIISGIIAFLLGHFGLK